MRKSAALATLLYACALATEQPTFTPSSISSHFIEQFVPGWESRWSASKATKETNQGEVFSYVGKWAVEAPTVYPGIIGDEGLVLKTKAAHHAISAPFEKVLYPNGDTLVLQYEVKLQKNLDCGGAYVKLLTESDSGIHAEEFSDKTPYTIMFGPDRCGPTSKVHFIIRHKNPVNGEISEHHLKTPPTPKISQTSTLYTLIVKNDQTFQILIDGKEAKTGSLLEDFQPPINPNFEIDDPEDSKPADWVESPKISDPDAVKPADWDEDAPETIPDEDAVIPEDWLVDEALTIPDPEAQKPEEWDDEFDGDWIAPSIPNPKCTTVSGCGEWTRPTLPNPEYKGKWYAPMIDNPEYKGVWKPRKIMNPAFFQDLAPADFNKMSAIGMELWSMTEDILFDNFFIGNDPELAAAFAKETFEIKNAIETAAEEAAAPKSSSPGSIPDFKTDPRGFVKGKFEEFAMLAAADPLAAVKQHPETAGAGLAGVVVLFFTLLSIVSKLTGSSKAKKTIKSEATTVKKTDAPTKDDAANSADAPIAEKKQTSSSVKSRVTAK